jgi:putative redox protein
MATQVNVSAKWNGKMAFSGKGHLDLPVPIDYLKPHGDDQGLMPLELLLISLAGCSGATLALLLGRAEQQLTKLDVLVSADRRTEHPTVLTKIHIEFQLKGRGLDATAVAKMLEVSENKMCPVWAMLKPGVPITSSFTVAEDAD